MGGGGGNTLLVFTDESRLNIIILTFIRRTMCQRRFICTTYKNLYSPPNDPLRQVLLSFLFQVGTLRHLLKDIQLVETEPGFDPGRAGQS